MRIDAHQHFWQYTAEMQWITEDMSVIRRSFTPADLHPVLQRNGIDGCIAVQADQTEEETQYLLGLAANNPFIKAVVGWIDLCADDIETKLDAARRYPLLKGFRHILQAEEPAFMLSDAFMRGISFLHPYGFTYDILVYPRHLRAVKELVAAFPSQAFVIDHLAKPDIKNRMRDQWSKDIREIAAYPNVYCKVSGMVTEANWKEHTQNDFVPYLTVVSEAFGTDRLMFGSDWPVCLVAAEYEKVLDIIREYYSPGELEKIMGANAARFYRL
jgi:L-fuconolactonase